MGVSVSRLRAADLTSLGQGLWARADSSFGEQDIVAAYCRLDPAVFAVGLTAARLWGFPLPGVFGKEVISPPAGSRRVRKRPAHSPPGTAVDRRVHLGTSAVRRRATALLRWSHASTNLVELIAEPKLALTSRVRTLLDLSSVLVPDALVAIGDHLVRQPRLSFEGRCEPHTTIEHLQEAAAQFTGRGALRAREAMKQVRMSSDSPAETRLRLACRRDGLPEPLANVRARAAGPGGAPALDLGEPDLHWPRWKVAVEHEGPSHLVAEQLTRDIARTERRTSAGWIEVRTTAGDLRDGCRPAIDRVRAALSRQGWTPHQVP